MLKICIIIPAHNEAKTIGPLVQTLKKNNLDVLVIDDGSSDDSRLIAENAGANVLYHQEKKGKGFSLQEGFSYALQKNYDAVIAMDGDGQHDPRDLPRFLTLAEKYPVSVINGSRMEDHQGMPWLRYLTNRFMSILISSVCGQRIADTQCGFRYIHCAILKGMNLRCNDFEIETEILMKACQKGFIVWSVPVKTIYQDERSKISPLKDTVRFFGYFLREVFNREK